jgi:hypothetical protein
MQSNSKIKVVFLKKARDVHLLDEQFPATTLIFGTRYWLGSCLLSYIKHEYDTALLSVCRRA